jgi:hypothetical protein
MELYSQHVNPIWVKLLDVPGLNVRKNRAVGAAEQQLDECVRARRDVVETMHFSAAFWSDALE